MPASAKPNMPVTCTALPSTPSLLNGAGGSSLHTHVNFFAGNSPN